MSKLLLLTIFPLFLTGCAIKPVSTDMAKSVPMDRIFSYQYFLSDDSKTNVVIKRDQGHVGSACPTKVLVDSVPVASLKMSEKMVIYLTAEKHILSSIPQGVCGGGIAELEIDLSAKKTVTFRIGFDGNATHRIQPTVF
ncbi:hypothetical protein HLH17_09350 [Acinetobacter sp. ANC 5380]|uniref:Lipoprotein n=1 Tax=Acinetobacter terrae TaxID=2731247 RepID=A0A7Y2RG61_9GAMM|nr:hypothetical protein [Acinetobacter terrae]NNH77861.1 hypothetical protein [Acinetobacter terrae]